MTKAALPRGIRAEIAHTAATHPGRTVTSIFLGGGTPSLMQPATVAGLLDAVAEHWPVAQAPRGHPRGQSVERRGRALPGLRAAGVNRVSLGIQALDDASLSDPRAPPTTRTALEAITLAQSAFERTSFDLIYAPAGQTPALWRAELKAALARAAEHLSLYQLTIEPGRRSTASPPPANW